MNKWMSLLFVGVLLAGCQQKATSGQPDAPQATSPLPPKFKQVNTNMVTSGQQIDLSNVKYVSQCSQKSQAISLGNSPLADEAGVSIFFGQLPHPGYGYKLISAHYEKGSTSRIQIVVKKLLPKPDMMYPQVIVIPCAFMPLENAPDIKNIDVMLEGENSVWLNWPTDGIGKPAAPNQSEYM